MKEEKQNLNEEVKTKNGLISDFMNENENLTKEVSANLTSQEGLDFWGPKKSVSSGIHISS